MGRHVCLCCTVAGLSFALTAGADDLSLRAPVYAVQDQPDSVYAPPAPPREDEGINAGAVQFDLAIRYTTDYVFRGVDRGEYLGRLPDSLPDGQNLPTPVDPTQINENTTGAEDRPNLQIDAKLDFDLGKLPHPYLGVFVNVFNADPLSRFQEVRPFFGAEWTLKPFIFDFGHVTYIMPEREYMNTSEVYARLTLDDRRVFRTERPVLSPYVYAAYDYDLYDGWYLEAGMKHDFILEDWGVTLTLMADAAYVVSNALYQESVDGKRTGFQHYDIGLIGSYSLNKALNISPRYGQFAIEGYLMWTDQLDSELLADPQIWGGGGIRFRY